MVSVMIGLLEVQFWVMRGDFKQFPIEVFPQFRSDDGMSIFGRIHNVVITEVYAVIVASIV